MTETSSVRGRLVRRVVTGVDAAGHAVIKPDGPAPVEVASGPTGSSLIGLWSTVRTPPSLDGVDLAGPHPNPTRGPPPGGVHRRGIVWQPTAHFGREYSTHPADLIYIVSGEEILRVGAGDDAVCTMLSARPERS